MPDPEIGRHTPYREIKRNVLSRSPAQLSVNWVELQTDCSAYQPTADKFYNAHFCARL